MDEQQEREVARGLREGKTAAWHAIYDAYCQRIWRSVAHLLGPSSADIADVVQETFLAAARSAGSYDPQRASLWTWLSGIARKQVALHFRKRKRHERLRRDDDQAAADRQRIIGWLEDRQEMPDEALANTELASMVRATLTELPADYETLLTAKYFDGDTVKQIAGQQRCSAEAVRSKLARARRAFRQAFARFSR